MNKFPFKVAYAGNVNAVAWVCSARAATEAAVFGLDVHSCHSRDSRRHCSYSKDGCDSDFEEGRMHFLGLGIARVDADLAGGLAEECAKYRTVKCVLENHL